MLDEAIFLRQLSLVTPKELDVPITVIGAGGIGSWATLSLAKMGCQNISVVDFDIVEAKNTPSQIYTMAQRKMKKVEALRDTVKQMTNISIKPFFGKFQDLYQNFLNSQIIICGVDSLTERKIIWDKILSNIPQNMRLYIDARMGGEFLRLLTVSTSDPDSLRKYTKSINAKTEPHVEDCTARSIVYNTFICGGFIASTVKKSIKKQNVPYNMNLDLESVSLF